MKLSRLREFQPFKEKKVFLMKHTTEFFCRNCRERNGKKSALKDAQNIVQNMVNIISEDEEMRESLTGFISTQTDVLSQRRRQFVFLHDRPRPVMERSFYDVSLVRGDCCDIGKRNSKEILEKTP